MNVVYFKKSSSYYISAVFLFIAALLPEVLLANDAVPLVPDVPGITAHDTANRTVLSEPSITANDITLSEQGATGGFLPEQVLVGIYINQIYGLNLKDNKFTADFYIWFKYKNDALNPLKSFELKNGKIESITNFEAHKETSGLNHASARVVATVNEFWDVSKYPFDKHELIIEIEDGENSEDKVYYTSDTQNSGINPKAQTRGWKIDATRTIVSTNKYNTSYGEDNRAENNQSNFSNFSFFIDVSRFGYSQFVKVFSVLFFAVFMAFLTFFIYANSAPRFTLGASALVATAANSFVVSSLLPESPGFTVSDVFLLSSLFLILLSMVIAVMSMSIIRKGNERLAQRIDRAGAIIFFVLFLSCFSWVFQQV